MIAPSKPLCQATFLVVGTGLLQGALLLCVILGFQCYLGNFNSLTFHHSYFQNSIPGLVTWGLRCFMYMFMSSSRH